LSQPVSGISASPRATNIALCLSGGGFRAALFHLGGLRRLNELGVLSKVDVITSVSGGSILNGMLATRWKRLETGRGGELKGFEQLIAKPLRAFCSQDLRTKLFLLTRLSPANWGVLMRDFFAVPASFLAAEYEAIFQRAKLGDLPSPNKGETRFVFCATNFLTGACWQFHGGSNARMGDFYTGYRPVGETSVAEAVAASSAFPPGFAGLTLARGEDDSYSRFDPWGVERPSSTKRAAISQRQSRIVLTDGGVYDNLGVEPVWHRCNTLFVSDAGRPFASTAAVRQSLVSRLTRAADISGEQVAAVRRRWLLEQILGGRRKGAVWMINTSISDFPERPSSSYCRDVCGRLNAVRTDLNGFSEGEIACLENHGYALADAAARSYARPLCGNIDAPFEYPNPDWLTGEKAWTALRSNGRGLTKRLPNPRLETFLQDTSWSRRAGRQWPLVRGGCLWPCVQLTTQTPPNPRRLAM
jgi:NTE family protein